MDSTSVRTAPWWVKLLVLWHVFCITVWACPAPGERLLDGKVKPPPLAVGDWIRLYDQQHLKESFLVKDYLFTNGAWQYWDMFAPNPAFIDYYGDAIIKYKDGSTKTSLYPRMYLLPLPQKYVEERFRKFYERGHDETRYPYIFTPFAYRQALLNYSDPRNPPVEVSLRRNWHIVLPPGERELPGYQSFVYFIQVIDPKLLVQLKDGS